jgi:hypothetical protein
MLKNAKSKYNYNKNIKESENKRKSKNNNNEKNDDKERILNTEFIEKVLKFVKYDDLIKKEKEEYKNTIDALEGEKQQLELYLIKFLQSKDKDIINTQNGIIKMIECNKKKTKTDSDSDQSGFKLKRTTIKN